MGYSKNKISGIYCFKNIINNKVYIGKSYSIYERKDGHIKDLKNNKHHSFHFQRAWNKYGEENFEHNILEKCNEELLNNKELEYIKMYKSDNRKYGYNIVNSDNKFSKESRLKLSESLKKSDKFKKARFTSWLKKERRKINQYDLNGNFIKTFNSVTEASLELNIRKYGIYTSLKTNASDVSYKNFMFKYTDIFNNQNPISPYSKFKQNPYTKGMFIIKKEKRIFKKVLCYDLNNNLLNTFLNCSDAARKLNLDCSVIAKACNNKIKYYKNYKFKYLI